MINQISGSAARWWSPAPARRRIRAALTAVIAIVGMLAMSKPREALATLAFMGEVEQVAISEDRVDLTTADGSVARLEMLDSDLVRVRIAPTGSFSSRSTGAVSPTGLTPPSASILDLADGLIMASDDMTLVVFKNPFRLVALRPDGSVLVSDASPAVGYDIETGLVYTQKLAPSNEGYFGFGFRGGPIDRRGRSLVMFNNDNIAYTEFTDPLYLSIPFYYGINEGEAHGIFVDNAAVPFFDVDSRDDGTLLLGALAGELDYYIIAGPEPAAVARSYSRLTGFTPLPPKWSLGFQQSRFGYRSQQEFLDLAQEFRDRAIPCDVLYFDLDYLDQLQLFTWNPLSFPSPEQMNGELDAMGFKRVNIIDPVVHVFDRLWGFLDGVEFFLRDSATGQTVINDTFIGDVSWLDFTRDDTKQWYKETLATFLSTGISAVWNDLNEPAAAFTPTTVYDFNGDPRSDLESRNLYALEETEATFEAQLLARPSSRPWTLSRSGFSGIQRYAANWSGDTLTSFDSLRVSIQISTSMGLSGQNFFGHDIGGFLGSPSPELFIRWLQFGSFTPLFRNHAVNTAAPREPWAFGEPYTEIIRRVIEARYRLLPYTYTLFEAAARDGTPVLAPTLFHFPNDPSTQIQDSAYMWGRQMLVAPVAEEGAISRELYLPAGVDWYDFNTDARFTGGQTVVVPAPLDRIPVFVRAGAIVPFGPIVQYTSEPAPPEAGVEIYPGPDSSFELYEDDGESFQYRQGAFLRTRLSQSRGADSTRFSIERVAGDWSPAQRPWNLRFHALADAPSAVTLNGQTLVPVASEAELADASQGWFWQPENAMVRVKITDAPGALTVEVVDGPSP